MILSSGIDEFIVSNINKVKSWMLTQGGEFDYSNPENLANCRILLYNATLDLYDECMAMEVSSDDYSILSLALKNAFKANAITESIKTEFEILSMGATVGGRVLRGADGVIEFRRMFTSEFNNRLNVASDEALVLDSLEKISEVNSKAKLQNEIFCNYDIPQLDDMTPIMSSRLICIAADPGVGKTSFCCYLSSKAVFEKHKKVVYMCGETPKNKIKDKIISNHIKRAYDTYVTPAHISGQLPVTDEVNRLINLADLELAENGGLILRDAFCYDTLYDDLKELYETTKFNIVFIDHSAALRPAPSSRLRTNKERIDEAVDQAKRFKNDYPVTIVFLSHLSSEGEKELKKFGRIKSSPTRDSGALAKDCDDLYILYDNDILSATGKKGLQTWKRRDGGLLKTDVILKFTPTVCEFTYKDEFQLTDSDELRKEEALTQVAKAMKNDGIEEEELSLDFDMEENW